jgi:hypothetical protein
VTAARDLAARVRAPDERTQAIPGHEVDELLLLTSWFRTRPKELEKTVQMTRVEKLLPQTTA